MCFSLVLGLLFAIHIGYMQAEPVDGEIIFDSSMENMIEVTTEVKPTELKPTKVKMPAECAGKSYCTVKGPDYPEDTIAYLLKDIRNLNVDGYTTQSSVGNRNGNSKDQQDCPDDSTSDPIYYIVDTNDEVRVVVQLKDKFEQIYTVRWCLKPGPITEDTIHFLKGTTLKNFNMECVDTTMPFDFFVLAYDVDPETKKPSPKMEIANAKGGIPVCCRCRYDPKS